MRPTSLQTLPRATGCLTLVILWLAAGTAPHAQNGTREWNRFRGPNGSGVADGYGLPAEIGPAQNVKWKTPLPPGHSSPVISHNRVFLTAVDGERLLTIALDRASGEILWQAEAPRPRMQEIDRRNNAASPSPAVAGNRVFVFFSDFGLLAYDFGGKEVWRHPLGPFHNVYGMGASPVVVDDKVILVCDQSTGSFLIAVSAQDGRPLWKVSRPEARSGHSTPIVYSPAGGAKQLLVPGSFFLTAYDPATGKKLWWVGGLSFEMKSTPVMEGETVFINGYGAAETEPGRHIEVQEFSAVLAEHDANHNQRLEPGEVASDDMLKAYFPYIDLNSDDALDAEEWAFLKAAMATTNGILAIRAGGSGDMSAQSIRWQYHRAVPQLPSPLLYRGVLYMINDNGIVTTFRPGSGEVIAQGRIPGGQDNFYASPVAGDGKIYLVGLSGKVAVLKPGGSLETISIGDLDDLCYATPAIADGHIYIRTRSALYAFAQPAGSP